MKGRYFLSSVILLGMLGASCAHPSIGKVVGRGPGVNSIHPPGSSGRYIVEWRHLTFDYSYTNAVEDNVIRFVGHAHFNLDEIPSSDLEGGEFFLQVQFVNKDRVIITREERLVARFDNPSEPLPFDVSMKHKDEYRYVILGYRFKYYY